MLYLLATFGCMLVAALVYLVPYYTCKLIGRAGLVTSTIVEGIFVSNAVTMIRRGIMAGVDERFIILGIMGSLLLVVIHVFGAILGVYVRYRKKKKAM